MGICAQAFVWLLRLYSTVDITLENRRGYHTPIPHPHKIVFRQTELQNSIISKTHQPSSVSAGARSSTHFSRRYKSTISFFSISTTEMNTFCLLALLPIERQRRTVLDIMNNVVKISTLTVDLGFLTQQYSLCHHLGRIIVSIPSPLFIHPPNPPSQNPFLQDWGIENSSSRQVHRRPRHPSQ